MKISHILVTYEYEACDLERKLAEGVPFEDLAKKYSTCPSRTQGGELGDLTTKWHLLDEAFVEAAKKLKPGEISRPTKTRFGWHLIKA